MSVIIRLQNLPWSANASDVRGFFRGLGIPDGGVHIVGGENGDAFIAFSTDEDARQAMMLNGSKLKETQVSLLLSSRAEMQKVIETARQQTISFMNFSAQQPSVASTPSLPVIATQIAIPGIQAQSSILNGTNSVVGLMDQQHVAKPQPPIITSSSLSGILAQQMLQQHQIQLIRQQQNMPVLTSTSVRHDAYKSMHNQYNSMNNQYGDDTNGKSMQGNDSKRSRNSRSRSRSRDRRDRKRSRSRERSRRYRDRSRSRERRRRSRRSPSSDRRSRSRGRSSRDNARKDRSYDKDVRLSLDRNKSVDESKANFNSSIENSFNAQTGVSDQQKSLNQSDAPGSISNFNGDPNDGSRAPFNNFSNPSRNDYPSKIMNEFEPMVPFKDADNSTTIGSCIRITNMNNRTHYAAIRKFFYGLQIPNDGIKLLNDENGKRRNDVVIRFARPDIARDALALDSKMLNGNFVRIMSISDDEYENEVDSFQPPRRNTGRYGSRYDDRNFNGDNRGGSEENNSRDTSHRRNNRDHYDRGYQKGRFNDDSDGHGNDSRDRHGDDDDVMLITDSNDGETTPVGLTLLIEDLPPFAKEQDIIKMFSDFTLMDIMLAKVNKVFRAYVKFHNQSDAEAALKQTHLHRIDFKSVYVSPCSEEAYEKAKQEYDGIGDIINKPEFIPKDDSGRDDSRPSYNEHDDFRSNSSRGENEVDEFGRNIRNRKFVNPPQQQPCVPDTKSQIPSLFNVTFDPPFIANQQSEPKFVPADPRLRRQFDKNSQSPDSQLSPNQQQQQPKAFNPFNSQGRIDPRLQRNNSLPLPNLTNNTNTKVIFIGNVEYNTSEADIVSFFADIGATPENVFFVKNARGQPCGDCYVKFKSADDATKALIKNRFRFRSRVIRVTLAEPDDAAKVLGFKLTDTDDETIRMNDSESLNKNDLPEESASEVKDKNDLEMDTDALNAGSQNAERVGNDEQADDDNSDDNNGRFDRGMTDGGGQFQREDPRMMYNAPFSRGGNVGSNMVGSNYNRGGGRDSSRGMRGANYNQSNAPRNFDGCIVSLNNVPFAATPRDIADFFGEYNLGPNDIIRRFNDDGSLTGEARVRFLTPMDASEAIERHQRERIRNRVIHLRLVT